MDLFDASRAGVVSDRKRTRKVQEKVRHLTFGVPRFKSTPVVAAHLVSHIVQARQPPSQKRPGDFTVCAGVVAR